MSNKYKLTKERIEVSGKTLTRIRATRSFGNIKRGQMGGFIESKKNLSHSGNCWIGSNAKVHSGARIEGNALVTDNSEISGKVIITDNARIEKNATVKDNVIICSNAIVTDHATVIGSGKSCIWISGYAVIKGTSKIYGSAIIEKEAVIEGNAAIYDYPVITDNVNISGNVIIKDSPLISGHAIIYGNVIISGCPKITDHSLIHGNEKITKDEDLLTIGPIGSLKSHLTVITSNGNCYTGFFSGTIDDLERAAEKNKCIRPDYQDYLDLLPGIRSIISRRKSSIDNDFQEKNHLQMMTF